MTHPVLDAMLLGALRGVTEFLPASADGHLALSELLFGVSPSSSALRVAFHAAAIVVVLWSERHQFRSRAADRLWGADGVAILLASLPTLTLGLVFRDSAHAAATSPLILGLGFLGSSGWVLSTRWVSPGRQMHLSWLGALVVGFAQGLSAFPGLSRCAGSLSCALWLGLRADRAFDLSLLMALPAFVLAIAVDAPAIRNEPLLLEQTLVGFLLFAAGGLLALAALRNLLQNGKLWLVALWTLPLSLATLALSWAWPR